MPRAGTIRPSGPTYNPKSGYTGVHTRWLPNTQHIFPQCIHSPFSHQTHCASQIYQSCSHGWTQSFDTVTRAPPPSTHLNIPALAHPSTHTCTPRQHLMAYTYPRWPFLFAHCDLRDYPCSQAPKVVLPAASATWRLGSRQEGPGFFTAPSELPSGG